MPDLESVLHAWECCTKHPCGDCQYREEGDDSIPCEWQMTADAMELLKGFAEKQTPLPPIKTPETVRDEFNCGSCTSKVGYRFRDGDWYFKANYCPKCGRAVKWDG